MAAIESGRITTKAQVKNLAEQWDTAGDESGGVHERVRRAMGRGREAPTEAESKQVNQINEDRRPVPGMENFGVSLGELKALAGIGRHGPNNKR
jgi:hypothetical protein